MAASDWLFDASQNRLVVLIGGKHVLVRCRSLHQIERYGEVVEAQKAKAAAAAAAAAPASPAEGDADPAGEVKTTSLLMDNLDTHLDYAEIALNPEPGKCDWPRQVIREKLDPDQVQLLAEMWLARFLRPRVERDPNLPPPPAGVR